MDVTTQVDGTFVPLNGSFALEYLGERTSDLTYDANETEVERALEALGTVGDVDVTTEYGVDEFGSTSIVERNIECERAVIFGQLLGSFHFLENAPRHPPVTSAYKPDAHSPIVEFVAATAQQIPVEVEQELHFLFGTAPVLGRECIHSKPLHTSPEAAFDSFEECVFACFVTFGPG